VKSSPAEKSRAGNDARFPQPYQQYEKFVPELVSTVDGKLVNEQSRHASVKSVTVAV
jgi:hypothetical protein